MGLGWVCQLWWVEFRWVGFVLVGFVLVGLGGVLGLIGIDGFDMV